MKYEANAADAPTVIIDWQPDKSSPEPVYRQIVQYISKKIAGGDWLIGSRLPSQRRLASLFQVNRSTIVAAMDELSSYGVLESSYGSGTRVASNTWSLLMSTAPPDWGSYLSAGAFKANVPTIQVINKLEFESGYIRLGTGELAPELFPHDMMRQIFQRLPDRLPSLNYLGTLGLLELRQAISKRLALLGIDAPPSCILITSGSLQALHLISVCMLKQGDTVLTEAPSYLKSLQVFQSAGIHLSGIPMDSQGLMPWMMHPASLIYTIPSFHNPTGAVMSQARRKELFQYCTNNRIPMIEDNAYGELWLDEAPPLPIKAMDTNGMILYLGTISKTLAPGLRIGWMAGPESVVQRLGDVKMQVDYGASSVSQWALAELYESGLYDQHLSELRIELKKRRDFALRCLERWFSELACWEVPNGSFYIWLQFQKKLSTDQLFQEALKSGLLLNPGSIYDFSKNHALRLSYAYAAPEELERGLEELSRIVNRLL